MTGRKKVSPDVTFDPAAEIAPSRALVPSVMKLNEQRVQVGFWPKMRRVAARVPFAKDALSVWYCARDDDTPIAAKGMMLAAGFGHVEVRNLTGGIVAIHRAYKL